MSRYKIYRGDISREIRYESNFLINRKLFGSCLKESSLVSSEIDYNLKQKSSTCVLSLNFHEFNQNPPNFVNGTTFLNSTLLQRNIYEKDKTSIVCFYIY